MKYIQFLSSSFLVFVASIGSISILLSFFVSVGCFAPCSCVISFSFDVEEDAEGYGDCGGAYNGVERHVVCVELCPDCGGCLGSQQNISPEAPETPSHPANLTCVSRPAWGMSMEGLSLRMSPCATQNSLRSLNEPSR